MIEERKQQEKVPVSIAPGIIRRAEFVPLNLSAPVWNMLAKAGFAACLLCILYGATSKKETGRPLLCAFAECDISFVFVSSEGGRSADRAAKIV